MSLGKKYKLNFMGDVMLGRLIDQLMPIHVHEPSEQKVTGSLVSSRPSLKAYGPASPWGSTLGVLGEADINLINLETAVTSHGVKWPNKVFNYRMHPDNLAAILKAGRIGYAGLANNHTLDFGESGLLETVKTVEEAGVAFAGAGRSVDESQRPASLYLPVSSAAIASSPQPFQHRISIYALSDHPEDWSQVKLFHHLNGYTPSTRTRLRSLLLPPLSSSSSSSPRPKGSKDEASIAAAAAAVTPALKIVSVHWGPNYSLQPADQIVALAQYLIDECGVDIIHGHSAHHVQAIELYHGKLIVYGCGDFVDDYAVVRGDWRNDLSAIWQVHLREEEEEEEQMIRRSTDAGADTDADAVATKEKKKRLVLDKLEIYPTRIRNFQAQLLLPSSHHHINNHDKGGNDDDDDGGGGGDEDGERDEGKDHDFVIARIKNLTEQRSSTTRARIRDELGPRGQLVVDL